MSKSVKIGPCPEPQGSPETYESFAARLDWLRNGVGSTWNEDTNQYEFTELPGHEADRRLMDEARKYFRDRGSLFRAPYPYYLDRELNHLIRLDGQAPCPEFMLLLRRLHLLDTQKDTKLIASNLRQIGEVAKKRDLHRLSYMSDSAIYLNAGDNKMVKVTADAITEAPIDTDGVVLIADDIAPWPSLDELLPLIEDMRPAVGTACTKLLPELPLTRLLTSRWSHDSLISAEQAHQMFLTRFLFIPAASAYSLWPLTLLTGEQGSAKSTPFELALTLLNGKFTYGQALPAKEDALIATVTNKSYVVYDNIDGANLDDPKKAGYSDTLCHLATGAEIGMRRLFTTNQLDTYSVKNHAGFTSRVNVFTRSDVMRRCIHLDIAPPDGYKIAKTTLLGAILDNRPALLAEYILRTQNILRAHLAAGSNSYPFQSEMVEYEAFTLCCAAYEGTMDSTVDLWAAYMTKYSESISVSNPMVFAVRLWLGKADNSDRAVSAAALFGELVNIHEELGQTFTYRAPNAFGMAIAKQVSSLRVLGYSRIHTRRGTTYRFSPTPEELQQCRTVYQDMAQARANRPNRFGWDSSPVTTTSPRRGEPTDEELEATLAAIDDEFIPNKERKS